MNTEHEDQEEHTPPVEEIFAAMFGAAAAAEEQVEGMRRILTAIVRKIGPVIITHDEYEQAPVADLVLFEARDDATPDLVRMGWALPEHFDQTGDAVQLTTVEALVEAALDEGIAEGLTSDRLATTVVEALGLPTRGEG